MPSIHRPTLFTLRPKQQPSKTYKREMFHSVRPPQSPNGVTLLIESCSLLILQLPGWKHSASASYHRTASCQNCKSTPARHPFFVSRQLTPQPNYQTRLPYSPILLRPPLAPPCPITTSQIVVAQAQIPLDDDVESGCVPDSNSGEEMGVVCCEPRCD
jgi:hypothetical protein